MCAKCGCVDNTATSSYWMLTNEYMVDKFDYAKELQPYKGMGLCSECGRLATSPDGRQNSATILHRILINAYICIHS